MKILICVPILVIVLIGESLAVPKRLPIPSDTGTGPEVLHPCANTKNENKLLREELKKQVVSDIGEVCYERQKMPTYNPVLNGGSKTQFSNLPVRGWQKTLQMLVNISMGRNHTSLRKLRLPPTLQRALLKETTKSQRTQLVNENALLCPKAHDLAPCVCEILPKTINCSATGNFTLIKEIFNTIQFPDTRFFKFLMHGMGHGLETETVLLDNTFGPVTFEQISIENTNLQEVKTDAFAGSENYLDVISMKYNHNLQTFPFQHLHRFSKLTQLELSYGNLQQVPSLPHVSELEYLYLNHNQIQKIGFMAFAELPKLSVLDLALNDLDTIANNDLYFSASDILVYLDNNNISSVEDKAFGKEQPYHLDISSNQLIALSVNVFKPMLDDMTGTEYLNYVDATENPVCCKDIEWILTSPNYSDRILLPDLDCSTS